MSRVLYTVSLPGDVERETTDFDEAQRDVVRACIEGAQRALDNGDHPAVIHYLQQAKMALRWVGTAPPWISNLWTYRTVTFHPDRVYASIQGRRVEDD